MIGLTTKQQARIGRAMAQAVTRANQSPEKLAQKLDELENENERLRAQLAEADQLIRKLRAIVRANVPEYAVTPPSAQMYDGHPVITVREAARLVNRSQPTVYRWCAAGKLQAEQTNTGRWLVLVDGRGNPKFTK